MATNRILLAKGPNGSNLDQLFDIKNDAGKKTLILNKTYDLSATIVHDNYYEKSVLNKKFANLSLNNINDLELVADLSANDASFNDVLIKKNLTIDGNLNLHKLKYQTNPSTNPETLTQIQARIPGATVVYVDENGNDTNGGTVGNPYKTLSAAITAKAGATDTATIIFYLAAGNYDGTISITKTTANQEIHIIGVNRATVNIRGAASWSNSIGNVLHLENFTNISIQNVTIMNGKYGFNPKNCGDLSIINCKFIHCGSSGDTTMHDGTGNAADQAKYKWDSEDALATNTSDGGAMNVQGCTNLDIRDNLVTYCFRGYRIEDGVGGKIQNNRLFKTLDNGIFLVFSYGSALAQSDPFVQTSDGCKNISVINNTIEYSGHHGLALIGGKNNTFYGNTVKHSWAAGIYVNGSINIDFINNLFIGNNSKAYNGYGVTTEHLAQIYASFETKTTLQGWDNIANLEYWPLPTDAAYFMNITNNTFEDCGVGTVSESKLFEIKKDKTALADQSDDNLYVSNNKDDCSSEGSLGDGTGNDWTFDSTKIVPSNTIGLQGVLPDGILSSLMYFFLFPTHHI